MKYTLSFVLFIIGIFLLPISAAHAVILAEVGVRDPHVVSQTGNTYTVSFEIRNGQTVQTNVGYSIRLIPFVGTEADPYIIADEHVYAESLNLSSNQSLQKVLTYTPSASLKGRYRMLVMGRTTNSLPLFSALITDVDLKGTSGIFIDPTTCYLNVAGETQNTKYTLSQGVDILPSEILNLQCKATNLTAASMTVHPDVATNFRTSFGKEVQTPSASETFIFPSKGSQTISIALPKPADPQAYNSLVSFSNGSTTVSNIITAHWVLRGKSATVQNINLDKTSYKSGETAKVSFMWTGSADSFEGSRLGTSTPLGQLVASVSLCGEVKNIPLKENEDVVSTGMTLHSGCANPKISVSILNGSTTLSMLSTTIVNPSHGSMSPSPANSTAGFGIVTLLAILIVIILLRIHKLKMKHMSVVVFLLSAATACFLSPSQTFAAVTTYSIAASTAVDTTLNTISISASVTKGQALFFTTTGTEIGGLRSGTRYFVSSPNCIYFGTACKVKLTDTLGGTAIDFTSKGTGTHKFTTYQAYTFRYDDASTQIYYCNFSTFPTITPVPVPGRKSFTQYSLINLKASVNPQIDCYSVFAGQDFGSYGGILIRESLINSSQLSQYSTNQDNNDDLVWLDSGDTTNYAGSLYTGMTASTTWYYGATRSELNVDNVKLAGTNWAKSGIYVTELDSFSPGSTGGTLQFKSPFGTVGNFTAHINGSEFYPGQRVTVLDNDFTNRMQYCTNGAQDSSRMDYQVFGTQYQYFSGPDSSGDTLMTLNTSYFMGVVGDKYNYTLANGTTTQIPPLSPGYYYAKLTLHNQFVWHDSRDGRYDLGIYTIPFTVKQYPSVGFSVVSPCNGNAANSPATTTLSWTSLPYVANTVYYDTDSGGNNIAPAGGATVGGYRITRFDPATNQTIVSDPIVNYARILATPDTHPFHQLTYHNAGNYIVPMGTISVDATTHKIIATDTSVTKGKVYQYSLSPIFWSYTTTQATPIDGPQMGVPVSVTAAPACSAGSPPSAPIISGPTSGVINTPYVYSAVSTLPQVAQNNSNAAGAHLAVVTPGISYDFAFEATSTIASTTGVLGSGISASINRTWTTSGFKVVYARARDATTGLYSDWASRSVAIDDPVSVGSCSPDYSSQSTKYGLCSQSSLNTASPDVTSTVVNNIGSCGSTAKCVFYCQTGYHSSGNTCVADSSPTSQGLTFTVSASSATNASQSSHIRILKDSPAYFTWRYTYTGQGTAPSCTASSAPSDSGWASVASGHSTGSAVPLTARQTSTTYNLSCGTEQASVTVDVYTRANEEQ